MSVSIPADSRLEDAVLVLFRDNELSRNVVKLKSPMLRKGTKKPTNWKDRAKQLESQDDEKPSPPNSPAPVVTQLDEKDILSFATGRPLQDEPDYKICKHCKKPVIKTVIADHIRACLRVKAERTKERKRQREEAAAAAVGKCKGDILGTLNADGNGEEAEEARKKGTGAKKTAKKHYEPGGAKGKKRKADAVTFSKEPKAKKKKEKPVKPEPKPKAPVDVERQCGVQLPNGALCARSLTCKSHSMGAKRSVLGRSQPYDILLAAYQKKNQAKQQKAAINAGGPPPEEIEANAMPVDSDEETELVMTAIARHVSQPMEHHVMIPVRKKSQYIRMRDVMTSALRPGDQSLYKNDSGGNGLLVSMLM
ncbi:SCA7-domain-containing protein [Wilcoxina mikolae CBS 423.85]|nr:SCA7-domain-containing protein [Wilcoxina mikolae CBS 423.85]